MSTQLRELHPAGYDALGNALTAIYDTEPEYRQLIRETLSQTPEQTRAAWNDIVLVGLNERLDRRLVSGFSPTGVERRRVVVASEQFFDPDDERR